MSRKTRQVCPGSGTIGVWTRETREAYKTITAAMPFSLGDYECADCGKVGTGLKMVTQRGRLRTHYV